MGLFGPTPKEVNRGGKVTYVLECNRGKCKHNKFESDDKGKCKREFNQHQRVHDGRAKDGAKSIDKLKQKRAKKGKCEHCGKNPCRMDRKACIQEGIKDYGSSMDIDVSDPATFNEQLKFFRDNM